MLRFTKIIPTIGIAALVVLAARPSMAAVTTNVIEPFFVEQLNPCNGDNTAFTGLVHLLASTTFDAAGVHTEVHLNQQDARATDLVTGLVCPDTQGSNSSGLNIVFSLPIGNGTPTGDLPLNATVGINTNESCPSSSGGSFTFKLVAHITVNPDGTVTVQFEKGGEITCRGR
jgi:hypothetical protein